MNKSRNKRRTNRQKWLLEALESRSYLSAISFANHVDFADGAEPTAIVTGEFNNDTHLDLATADASLKTVNVFFGTGSGTFTTGPVLTLTAPASSMVAGDFNHDGFTDLAVGSTPGSNGATTVTVFLNNGVGGFSSGLITTITSNATLGDAIDLTAGNFNGDANLDLATANFDEGTVSVLLGNGDGTFAPPVNYTVGQSPTSIVTGHFASKTSLDLAVADQRAVSGGGQANVITLLNGVGDGTFTTGPDIPVVSTVGVVLNTADFNADGLTDLVAGTLNDSVEPFANTGSEQFTALPLVSTSGPVAAVAVADFNFDSIPDLVEAQGGTVAVPGNDQIGVATGAGSGTFSTTTTIPSGTQPVAIAVGDFNGDHKPDLAIADFAGGTVSIMLNTTPGTPQEATTTTLTTSAPSAAFGADVTLTATVTGPTDAGLPTGTVNFYNGSTLLGSGTIPLGTDQAVLDSTTLPVGTLSIIARYVGDGTFSASNSSPLSETITPTAGHGPDLVATFVSTTLPSVFSPGEKGSVKFKITNQGNFAGSGSITNALYLSLDDTLDAGDIPITIKGPLASKKTNLAVGKSEILTGTFTIPAGVSLGNYVLLADINTTDSLPESDTTNNTGASSTLFTATDEFGTVGGKANVTLVLPDVDGTQVMYKLTGPGTGTVNVGDSGIDVVLTGTTAATTLTITGKGGDNFVELHSLSDTSAIGTIKGATVDISDGATLAGVARLTLNNVGGAFAINGASVQTIKISGQVNDSQWNISGSVNQIATGKILGGSWIIAGGAVSNFTANDGIADATIGALTFNSINIKGDLSGTILAGGTYESIAGIAQSGGIPAGSIRSLRISGNAAATAFVAVGLDASNGNVLMTGGSLGSLTINGSADPASRFLADILPAKAKIGSTVVIPATDPRFHS